MQLLRRILAVLALVILAWRLVRIRALLRAVESSTSVVAVPWNEAVQKAVEMLVDQSGLWAQATALLLGVLLALWMAKGDEPQLALTGRLWPEITIWSAGTVLLLAGLYCYNEYVASVAAALEAGGVTSGQAVAIPNVFDEKYDALRTEQFRLLLFGAVASGLAVFSVRHLAAGHHAHQ